MTEHLNHDEVLTNIEAKKYDYAQNQKEKAEISRIDNEERGYGESDTHWIYVYILKSRGTKKTVTYLMCICRWMTEEDI